MKQFFRLFCNRPVRRALLALTLLFAVLFTAGFFTTRFQAQQTVSELIRKDQALLGGSYAGKPIAELCIFTGEVSLEDLAAGSTLLKGTGYDNAPLQSYPYYDAMVLQNERGFALWTLTAYLLSCAVLLFSCLVFYGHLNQLTRTAQCIANGKKPCFPVGGDGDEAAMRYAFSAMAERLQNSTRSLQKDKDYLKNFLSDVSHQLKTPLSALRMYMEILLENPHMTPETRMDFLGQSRSQIDRIDWLVQGLLRMARLEAGATEMEPRMACLLDTVQNALSPFYEPARRDDIALSDHVPSSIVLFHDSEWVAEAFGNLVKNALEHTPAGGHVTVSALETPLTVELTIQDDGEGMESTEIPHIFERFYRKGSGANTASVGIGLSLARSILEKNGADIYVKSEPGKGSRFIVTFLKQFRASSEKSLEARPDTPLFPQ